MEHCEVALFIGKNPWQSHSFPRARTTLKEIARDPERALIVVDPRRTETADLADIHLQVRPGTDAWLISALAAAIVRRGPRRPRAGCANTPRASTPSSPSCAASTSPPTAP